MPPPVITLLTDFGLADAYVASLKGVILGINPGAIIVDISHEVRPQAVEQGAFLLQAACPYFPPGAIHAAVVDPGVGTERRAVAIVTPHAIFAGPDNGLLSAALPDATRERAGEEAASVPLPPGVRAFELSEQRFHQRPVSATFHGRDIFAPVAAHLSLGADPEELGPRLTELVALPPFQARRQADGSLLGRVVHVDRFGNLVTTLRADQIESPDVTVTVEVAGRRVRSLAGAYGGAQGLIALIGGSGFLEIALASGSAARELKADIGAIVRLVPDSLG